MLWYKLRDQLRPSPHNKQPKTQAKTSPICATHTLLSIRNHADCTTYPNLETLQLTPGWPTWRKYTRWAECKCSRINVTAYWPNWRKSILTERIGERTLQMTPLWTGMKHWLGNALWRHCRSWYGWCCHLADAPRSNQPRYETQSSSRCSMWATVQAKQVHHSRRVSISSN